MAICICKRLFIAWVDFVIHIPFFIHWMKLYLAQKLNTVTSYLPKYILFEDFDFKNGLFGPLSTKEAWNEYKMVVSAFHIDFLYGNWNSNR